MCAAWRSCILRRGRIVRRRERGNTGSAALVGACPGKHPKALATGWRTLAQVVSCCAGGNAGLQARGLAGLQACRRAGARARRRADSGTGSSWDSTHQRRRCNGWSRAADGPGKRWRHQRSRLDNVRSEVNALAVAIVATNTTELAREYEMSEPFHPEMELFRFRPNFRLHHAFTVHGI